MADTDDHLNESLEDLITKITGQIRDDERCLFFMRLRDGQVVFSCGSFAIWLTRKPGTC